MARYPALDLQPATAAVDDELQDLLYALLDDFEPLAIHDDDKGGWRVFFRTPSTRDAARAALASTFGHRLPLLSPVDVDDEDWARRSQAALTAIHVGRIIVAPPWDVPTSRDAGSGMRDPVHGSDIGARGSTESPQSNLGGTDPESRIPDPDEIVIVIDPSMGFGTGHHATTRLCLQLLQEIEVRGKRVIDVGTGSGVLALAAWQLGASRITAIDYDPDALQNARENIAQNGATGAIDVVQTDLSAIAAGIRADVVVANLTGAVLHRYAANLRELVSAGGVMIVSGFSPSELDDVVLALGGGARRSLTEGEWAAALISARAMDNMPGHG